MKQEDRKISIEREASIAHSSENAKNLKTECESIIYKDNEIEKLQNNGNKSATKINADVESLSIEENNVVQVEKGKAKTENNLNDQTFISKETLDSKHVTETKTSVVISEKVDKAEKFTAVQDTVDTPGTPPPVAPPRRKRKQKNDIKPVFVFIVLLFSLNLLFYALHL